MKKIVNVFLGSVAFSSLLSAELSYAQGPDDHDESNSPAAKRIRIDRTEIFQDIENTLNSARDANRFDFFNLYNDLNKIALYYRDSINEKYPDERPLQNRLGVFHLDHYYDPKDLKNNLAEWMDQQLTPSPYTEWLRYFNDFCDLNPVQKKNFFPKEKREDLISSYIDALHPIHERSGFSNSSDAKADPDLAPAPTSEAAIADEEYLREILKDVMMHLPLQEDYDEQKESSEALPHDVPPEDCNRNPTNKTPSQGSKKKKQGNNSPRPKSLSCSSTKTPLSPIPEHGRNPVLIILNVLKPPFNVHAHTIEQARSIGFSTSELFGFLSTHISGQDHAMRAMASYIHKHFLGLSLNNWSQKYAYTASQMMDSIGLSIPVHFKKNNMLVIGPTGSGKTLSMEMLENFFASKNISVPIFKTSAASLTRTGYVGPSVSDMIPQLYAKARQSVEDTENGIIFIDEIDKIYAAKQEVGRDIGGSSVQGELLELIQGMSVEIKPGTVVNTSKILFICGGSFKDMASAEVNFMSDSKLTEFGFSKEFIGRFQDRIVFNKLNRANFLSILANPYESRLYQLRQLYKFGYDINLQFEPESLEAIADRAIQFETGARGIHAIVDRVVNKKLEIPDSLAGQKVVFTKADVFSTIKEPELTGEAKLKKEDEERKKLLAHMYL